MESRINADKSEIDALKSDQQELFDEINAILSEEDVLNKRGKLRKSVSGEKILPKIFIMVPTKRRNLLKNLDHFYKNHFM